MEMFDPAHAQTLSLPPPAGFAQVQGFDPLAKEESKTDWETMEDCDCPSIDNVAQADTTDIDTLKKACETQLKRKGIDVGVFVVDGQSLSTIRSVAVGTRRPDSGMVVTMLFCGDVEPGFGHSSSGLSQKPTTSSESSYWNIYIYIYEYVYPIQPQCIYLYIYIKNIIWLKA